MRESSNGPWGLTGSHAQFRVRKVNCHLQSKQMCLLTQRFYFSPEVVFLHVGLNVLKKSHSVIYLLCNLDIIFTAQSQLHYAEMAACEVSSQVFIERKICSLLLSNNFDFLNKIYQATCRIK